MNAKRQTILSYRIARLERVGKNRLGLDTILLAGLITSFFYDLPLSRYSVAGFATDLRIYDIAIGIIILFVGLNRLPKLRRLWSNRRQYHFWAYLLIIITFFSLIFTISLGGSQALFPALIRFYRFAAYLLIPGLIVLVVDTPERHRFLFMVFYINIAIQACLAFAQGVGWLGTFWPAYWTIAYGLSPVGTLSPHHLQIAIVMMMGIPLSGTLLRTSNSLFNRLLAISFIPIMAAVIIFSGTRSIWVALIPMALVYIYRHKVKGFGGIIVLAVVIAGFFWAQRSLVQNPMQQVLQERLYSDLETGGSITGDLLDKLSAGRVTIYSVDYSDVLRNKPWALIIGSGFENISSVLDETGAHDNYVQAWLELGVIGLIIYLCFLKAILDTLQEAAKHAGSSFERVLAIDSWVAFIGILVTMFANETLWAQYSTFTLTGQILIMVALATCPLNWANVTVDNKRRIGKSL